MKAWAWVCLGSALLFTACGSSSEEDEASGSGGKATTGGGGKSSTGSTGGTGASSGSGGSVASGGGTGGSAASDASTGGSPQGGSAGSGGSTGGSAGDGGPVSPTACLAAQYLNPPSPSVSLDYDQFTPTIGSHCKGTNHQAIKGVQKVVFLGDSVTVGTPPTDFNPSAVYRAILAKKLATLFNIAPPGIGWGGADYLNGVALPSESGDFISCSKWGARTDDLMKDNTQIETCIPLDKRNLHHLVVMTMGGNDIAAVTKDGGGATPAKTIDQLWQDTKDFVQNLRAAVEWMKNPANVPGGVDVVFANMYEFTDGTGATNSCATASLGGIEPWNDTQALADMVIWANEQYMKIAVDTKSDMIFMLESFCGHGYKRDDPTGPCYRGPNTPLWFDPTCIHPNDLGHAALADLFYQTIAE